MRERARLRALDETNFDIFETIDSAGIWLMFQPLAKLYGFYQRLEGVAGIVIHAGHPRSLQRFTAAHEYGHHVLGHQGSLDSRAEIEGQPNEVDSLQEYQAQAFAGALLMPLHLVRRTAVELSIPLEQPSPANVYDLSLRFGVSYSAMRTQLRTYDLISRPVFDSLQLSPLEIKTELGHGEPPANRRADLWVIDEETAPSILQLQIADEVIVRVVETRSSGYLWALSESHRPALELLRDYPSEQMLDNTLLEPHLGTSRTRELRFRATEPGPCSLRLGLSRSFAPDDELDSLDVQVTVTRRATGSAAQGLYTTQHDLLVARKK